MRKQHDFEMMDHIVIKIDAADEVKQAVEKHKAYIMKETLDIKLEDGADLEMYDLNGHKTGIDVKRIEN